MSHPAPSQPATPAPTLEGASAPVPGPLRWGVHLLVAALLALGAGRAALATPADWAAVACSGVVGAIYAVGARRHSVATSARAARVWLTLLLTAWVAFWS